VIRDCTVQSGQDGSMNGASDTMYNYNVHNLRIPTLIVI
jgi:hypothetical protein